MLAANRSEEAAESPIDLHRVVASAEGPGMIRLASRASPLTLLARRASNSQVLMRAAKVRV